VVSNGTKLSSWGIVVLAVAASIAMYKHRDDRCVLYYHGTLEVPQGRAIAILNPFRNANDEANAESLIRDLRTNQCRQIVRERLHGNPDQICPTMQRGGAASLIWLDPPPDFQQSRASRTLVYNLHESRARLFVYFARGEDGWGVSTASLVR
jgi:hypothetical protein